MAAFLLAFLCRKRHSISAASNYNIICATTLMMGIGIFGTALSRPSLIGFKDGTYCFSGRVIDYTATGAGDRTLLQIFSLEGEDNSSMVELSNLKGIITISDVSKITYGDIISGIADMTAIDAKGNFRNDDYVAYQKSKGILVKGFTTEDSHIEVIGRSSVGIIPLFQTLRDRIEMIIEKTGLSSSVKSFIISVGLGDRSYLSEEDRQAFIDGGVAHVFAVSGMHVGMFAGFILLILSLFFTDRRRKWKFIMALPLLWCYVLLTGGAPATIRAGLMLTIGFTALFLQRKNRPLMSLGWTLLIILAIKPLALFDIGLQLSAVCVGSLIMMAQPLNFIDHRVHPKLYSAISVILVTLTATLASWTLCAFYFHRISVMFLPANLIAVPLLPIYLASTAIYVLLCDIGLEITLVADILSFIYARFLDSVAYFNSLAQPIEDIHIGWPVVLLWLAGIAATGFLLQQRKYKTIWMPISLFLLSLLIIPYSTIGTLQDGFIVQKNQKEISIMTYKDGKENLHVFPANAISSMTLSGKKLIAMDKNPGNYIDDLPLGTADFVVLGSGIGKNIDEIHNYVMQRIKPNCTIVVHPSVHWRYERKIMDKGLPFHYSLRHDGPLHFFED